MKKSICFILFAVIITITITACSGNTLPNGRYEPVDSAMKSVYQAIAIDGNNFTIVMAGGMGMTYKYSYRNGTISFTDTGTGVSLACEYKDDSLWYTGLEFKRT